jgi:uncharacterized membrane protein YfcA
MNLDFVHIAGAAGVILLASTIQSAVGFAFALFSAPLLIWLGMPLPNTIATMAVCSSIQSAAGARELRAAVPWRSALTATLIRTLMFIAGLVLLKRLVTWDPALIKMIVGITLCALVAMQFSAGNKSAEHVHWAWGGLAFSSSGILAGVTGMGGPPLVLWSLAHNWSAKRTRGFLFAVFATSIPIQLFMLYVAFGSDILLSILIALCMTPAVILGGRIGMPIGNRMSKPTLRRIILVILLIIGVSSIMPAVIQKLG